MAQPKPWQRFLAGTASGAALTVVGHPLDTLRVRLQLSAGGTTLLAVVRALWRAEGMRGLYRGFFPPFALTGLVNTLLWGTQFSITDFLASRSIGSSNTSRAMLAAVPASAVSAFVVGPMELLKTRQQTSQRGLSLPALVRDVFAREGVRGFYTGFGLVCLCRLVGGWGYFGGNAFALDALAQHWPAQGLGARTRNTLLAGGFAGISYWCLAMPLDTVKSTIMATRTYGDCATPLGASATMRQIYARGGARAFYRGFSAAILRAFPANAVAFTSFDLTMKVLTHVQS